MSAVVTRVFVNGNSQAVRIPHEFRLDTRKVEISRTPDGNLLIHPLPADRGNELLEALKAFDEEFVVVLEHDHAQQPPMQEREDL